jgi:hypothetical protein
MSELASLSCPAAGKAARKLGGAWGFTACFALSAAVLSCASVQNAAARDPMKCERDPNCSRGRASYADCTQQCADNPECVARCEQVQQQVDGVGHP